MKDSLDSRGGKAADMQFIVQVKLLTSTVYSSNNTTVNICTVDLSNAFDNPNQSVLFQKLANRNAPHCFIELLQNWYRKCSCLIKFENCFSKIVPVQHGGALSLIVLFFCMWMTL